jgi:hypothetical protein
VNDKSNKFNNILSQTMKALDVFEKTGNRTPFIGLQDQIHTFADECFEEDLQEHIKQNLNLPFAGVPEQNQSPSDSGTLT